MTQLQLHQEVQDLKDLGDKGLALAASVDNLNVAGAAVQAQVDRISASLQAIPIPESGTGDAAPTGAGGTPDAPPASDNTGNNDQ